MTRNRPAGLDTPRAPLNHPPTRLHLSGDLVRLAVGMERVAVDMEYLGGFGEMGKHGRKMMDDARKALVWANRLRATQRTGEG